MELIDYVARSKTRYTNQFVEDPVYDALVQTIIEYLMKVQQTYLDFADIILDIDKSTGKNLDLIGSIVGQERNLVDYYSKAYFGFLGNPKAEPFDEGEWYSLFSTSGGDTRTLTDAEYRKVIRARIIRNKTNCSRGDLVKILDILTDKADYKIEYPSHGETNIILPSDFDVDFVLYFLSRTDEDDSLIPKPLGFKLNVFNGD